MITLEDFKKYIEIQDAIAVSADEVLKKINDISPVCGFSFLSFSRIEDDSVYFWGDDSWKYGGYEEYEFDIPVELIFDKNALDEYIETISLKVKRKKEQDNERERKRVEADKINAIEEAKKLLTGEGLIVVKH